jgi:two-component system, OmpR family, sensor histidine kinase SenX3
MRRALMRQTVLHHLTAIIGRLDPDGASPDQPDGPRGDLSAALSRLEEATAHSVDRLAEADGATRRLLAAFGHLAQGVVISDRQGVVLYRNPQAAMFVGARHGEALAERALLQLLTAAMAGETQEETIELFSPPRRTLVIRAAPLREGGGVLGAVAIIEDISERRRLEAIRRDFIANISHELKTPVGALSLVAETLEEEDDPLVIARLSRRMRAEAERLSRIIEDLLDLSRIEAEECPSRDPVPVHHIVAQAVERLRPVAEHQGIKLDVPEPPQHLVIRGDRRQLVSAVHNLVDNAIKYSENGSSVHVTVRRDGEWIEVAVADHGLGIPGRDLERIFERFYRVDRARSRDTGGTGLGLAIVRHVAGNHGGDVRVESREGEGSTFVLRLPGGTGATSRQGIGSKEATRG